MLQHLGNETTSKILLTLVVSSLGSLAAFLKLLSDRIPGFFLDLRLLDLFEECRGLDWW